MPAEVVAIIIGAGIVGLAIAKYVAEIAAKILN